MPVSLIVFRASYGSTFIDADADDEIRVGVGRFSLMFVDQETNNSDWVTVL